MNHIESQRDQLGRNLNELETRVKGATDWRVQFDKNPMLMMGVALGGGLLLGSIVGGARKGRSSRSSWSSSTSRNYSSAGTGAAAYGVGSSNPGSATSASSTSPAVRENRKKATDTLEHMKAALIGFATAKVKEFMTEALPGFNQHLDEAERKNTSANQGQGSYMRSETPSYDQQRGTGSQGSGSDPYGNPSTTRTDQSANSPYSQSQPRSSQPTGVNR